MAWLPLPAALECLLTVSAYSADRYVGLSAPSPGSGFTTLDTAAHTITGAVDAAQAGETVWVTNGTYTLSAEIAISKGITIRSAEGAAVTIVDGQGSTRCFNLSHASAVLDGVTVTNGCHASAGGGIYMTAGTVKNCTVASNAVPTGAGDVYGGGIYLAGGLVTNCLVLNNYRARRAVGRGLLAAENV